jgi:hypothetical protein
MARNTHVKHSTGLRLRISQIHAFDSIGTRRRVLAAYAYDEAGVRRQVFPGFMSWSTQAATSVNTALNPSVFAGIAQFQLLAATFSGSTGYNDTQTPSGTLTPSPVPLFGGRIAALSTSSTGIAFVVRNCPSDPGESALKGIQTSIFNKTVGGADYSGYYFSLGNIARWDWNNYVTPFTTFVSGQSYTVTVK